MSDIHYDMGTNLATYREILQRTIDEVLKKIGISDEGIEWIIFEEEKYMNIKKLPSIPSFIYNKNYRYGFCYIDKNEIWISTAAIQKAPTVIDRLLPSKEDNLLVDVILDELTHIETGRDHGDKGYDSKLMSFHKKYYG